MTTRQRYPFEQGKRLIERFLVGAESYGVEHDLAMVFTTSPDTCARVLGYYAELDSNVRPLADVQRRVEVPVLVEDEQGLHIDRASPASIYGVTGLHVVNVAADILGMAGRAVYDPETQLYWFDGIACRPNERTLIVSAMGMRAWRASLAWRAAQGGVGEGLA